jgi:hypothetical protein
MRELRDPVDDADDTRLTRVSIADTSHSAVLPTPTSLPKTFDLVTAMSFHHLEWLCSVPAPPMAA